MSWSQITEASEGVDQGAVGLYWAWFFSQGEAVPIQWHDLVEEDRHRFRVAAVAGLHEVFEDCYRQATEGPGRATYDAIDAELDDDGTGES